MPRALDIYAGAIVIYESVIYIWFLDQFLTRRIPRWIAFVGTFVLQFLFHEIEFYDTLKFGIELLCDLLVTLIFYKGNLLQNGIYTIVYYAIMFLCDTVCAIPIYQLSGIGFYATEQVTSIQIFLSVISRALLLVIIFLIKKIYPKDPKVHSKWFYLYPIPVTVVFVQFFFSPFAKETLYYTNPKMLYILVVIFMYVCMLYVILMQREQYRKTEFLHELQIMDLHHTEQLHYIKEIRCAYKNLSKNIHDARHHLDLLNTYIQASRWDKAEEFLNNLYSELGNAIISYTGNADIDSIIFSKQLAFSDVEIKVSGLLPESIFWLKTVDICTLLSNALENAAQACEGVTGVIIDVEFLYREWLIIIVKNPYREIPIMKNNQYISSKGGGHGLGIKSMQEIAEKYDGHVLIECTEKFELNIMLQNRNH